MQEMIEKMQSAMLQQQTQQQQQLEQHAALLQKQAPTPNGKATPATT